MGLDDYFDRFPAVEDQLEAAGDVGQRQAVSDHVIHGDIAGGDKLH